MQMEKKNLLTPNEITFILIGIMMDVSVANLPNDVITFAKQDGWLSVIIGAIYPLYIALLSIYVSEKFPNKNILMLSKMYLGNILGTILNILFLLSFFSYMPALFSEICNIIREQIISSLAPLKIYIILFLLGAYMANNGVKVIGRVCSISFFIILFIISPTIMILKEGSYLNISPIFGAGIVNIIKGSKTTMYAYALSELIFLIYPFINDRKKIKSSVLKAVGFTCISYTWITFITIYYLGKDIIPKTIWSFFKVTEGVEIANNFKYIFISFWIIIGIKSIGILEYVYMFILDDIKKIKNKRMAYVTMAVILIGITTAYYKDIVTKNMIIQYTGRISTIYNFLYITLITFLIWIKKEANNEET